MLNIKSSAKKSQIWIETVIYLLIGITLISIILVTALPRIENMKDKSIIEQTAEALNDIDSKIVEIIPTSGNTRLVELRIAKGKIEINADRGIIRYILEDTGLELSQIDEEIKLSGNVFLLTEKTASKFKITLTSKYPELKLVNFDGEGIKTLNAGTVPHKILISNIGPPPLTPEDDTRIVFQIN